MKSISLLVLSTAFARSKNIPKIFQKNNLCDPTSWDQWTSELNCFWDDPDVQWWNKNSVSGSGAQWNDWNDLEQTRFENNYDAFYMSYYYDQTHQKVCLPGGDILSVSKVTANTMVTNCSQPTSAYQKPFAQVRHSDMLTSIPTTSTNFATVYDDKVKQGSQTAADRGHPDWSYGEYINYDHLPAKSIYSDSCNGGSSGQRLPTVAIMAIDHKGPVWSACTTSRSTSSDNARKSMAKMKEFINNNQYGRAILENLDCLLEAAYNLEMVESFTDYYRGFQNLIYLHYEKNDINVNERNTLLNWLDEAKYGDPKETLTYYKETDAMLESEDTMLTPDFC